MGSQPAKMETARYAFHMARRLREQGRYQETEDLLRWAVDGLRTELGDQKLDAQAGNELSAVLATGFGCSTLM